MKEDYIESKKKKKLTSTHKKSLKVKIFNEHFTEILNKMQANRIKQYIKRKIQQSCVYFSHEG